MSEMVSTLASVALKGAEYLFIFMNETEYGAKVRNTLQNAIESDAPTLGRKVGTNGRVIRVYPEQRKASLKELLTKPWPIAIRERMSPQPDQFVVICQTDFGTFDPGTQDWAIIWLGQLGRGAKSVSYVLEKLQEPPKGKTLFQMLDDWIKKPHKDWPEGSIATKSRPDSKPLPQKKHRDSILDPSVGIDELVKDALAQAETKKGTHGWRMRACGYIQGELKKKGFNFTPKAISDRLHKEDKL